MRISAIAVLLFVLGSSSTVYAQAQQRLTPEEIVRMQEALSAKGYYSGAIDGKVNPDTIEAMSIYLYDWRIPLSREVMPELLAMLEGRHPLTEPQWLAAEDSGCLLWNGRPMAREEVFWDGPCNDQNIADGWGRKTWRYIQWGVLQIDVYEGDVKDGISHGKGVHIAGIGAKYEGEWKQGLAHGQGKVTFADGVIYEGDFFEDELHGYGTMTLASGWSCSGEWRDGKLVGTGTAHLPDGRIESCVADDYSVRLVE